MLLNPNVLALDIKIADRYRQILSKLGKDGVQLKCVMLGDSDIDYEMSFNVNQARILNAPYSPQGIKYPLIYSGAGKGLKGIVNCFIRRVNTNGTISGLYNYPTNQTFSVSRVPPSLENGYNWSQVTYLNSKMGYIFFFETVLDNYVDAATNLPQRIKEKYKIDITFNNQTNIPAGWEITMDFDNGSMLISKDNVAVSTSGNYDGLITIEGLTTQNKKVISFNY